MPTPKHKAEAAPIRARFRSGRFGVKNCQFSVETVLRVNALNCLYGYWYFISFCRGMRTICIPMSRRILRQPFPNPAQSRNILAPHILTSSHPIRLNNLSPNGKERAKVPLPSRNCNHRRDAARQPQPRQGEDK